MREVFIVDGSRIPFLKAVGKPNALSAADLAVAAAKPLLMRQPFSADKLDDVIVGCVAPSANEANIARIIALRLGCGLEVPGWTVQRNCASGLQAIDCGFQDIGMGRYDLVLAGGTEAMSRAPLLFNEEMVEWLAEFRLAKNWQKKLQQLSKFKLKYLQPVISLLRALTDPIVNLSMGQTAEKLAYQFGISRLEMDQFALQSHQRVCHALAQHNFPELTPLFDWQGAVIEADNGVRADSNLEKLAQLKPVFDKPFGNVTAGNSSQVTDGAAFVLLASQRALTKYKLQPLAKISAVTWAALDPALMGLGPTYAIAKLLQQQNLTLADIDFWEINEAFAAQVIACTRALADQKFCQETLRLKATFGVIDPQRLNVDGGAIAIGHPVGASGARLAQHLTNILIRNNAKLGIASLCIGGGQGGAILLENAQL